MVNLEWLPGVLEERFGVKPTMTYIGKIEEASHGYMSQIKRVKLEWPEGREKEKLPDSVVVKAPVPGTAADAWVSSMGDMEEEEKRRQAADAAAKMKKVQDMTHTTEQQLYDLFDHDYPSPIAIPKCYACFDLQSTHPAIVMEDITNATIYDIYEGFTEKQIRAIHDAIIDMQVLSLTTDKWKKLKVIQDTDLIDSFTTMMKASMEALMVQQPKHAEALQKMLNHVLCNASWFTDYYKEYDTHKFSVLTHGDMWSPQFLWRGDKLAAIVDWQLAHPGNAAEDLLRLTTLCMPAMERKRLNNDLIEYHYKELCSRLAKKGAPPPPFTNEEFLEEYKNNLPYAAAMQIFAFCMFSHSPVLLTGKGDDEERVNELLERMMALVNECIEAYGW